LTPFRIEAIRQHAKLGGLFNIEYSDTDWWEIEISDKKIRGKIEKCICGDTSMTNFEMGEYFTAVGIPNNIVTWDHSNGPGSIESRTEKGRMTDAELIESFAKERGFEFIEKMAAIPEINKILANPEFKVK
jgi:hypothetical protein